MNPKTSLSKEQITEIFKRYNLAQKPKISRITTGFTNEVHQVNDYILKVCVRNNFEAKFKNEVRLYRALQGKALVPEFIVADSSRTIIDKPYMIYKKIPGYSLGSRWHPITNAQRRQIIKDFCAQIRIVSKLEPNPKLTPGPTWVDNNLLAFNDDMAKIKKGKLLPSETIEKAQHYIDSNLHFLEVQKLAFTYWDLNLDNIIVDEQGKMVGLIDFEHVGVVSIDYMLDIVKQTQEYPWLMLSQEMEKYADKEDYKHLMQWYKEFYPELFDFPDLDKRLDLYELEGVLRKIPRFPKAQQLRDRLARIIELPEKT